MAGYYFAFCHSLSLMGLGFGRSFKITSGVRFNLSGSGASVSLGGPDLTTVF